MNASDVLDTCLRHFIVSRRTEENITLQALFPDTFPIPHSVVDLVRTHKLEIVERLRWRERADALLLESVRRLADAWPAGCSLEGPEWEACEQQLHDAYHSGDDLQLTEAIDAREQFALSLFDAHRKQVTT